MRNHLLLFINGSLHRVAGPDALLPLSELLRRRLRLTGTKVVCSEGDCGACGVLAADLRQDTPRYRAIDSCIAFPFQLDCCHVVTVEGLSDCRSLTPVQQAMVDCHGSQCGFCTPGFVTAMTGVLEACCGDGRQDNPQSDSPQSDDQRQDRQRQDDRLLDARRWRTELTGNLCRCTGYASILAAAGRLEVAEHRPLSELYPVELLKDAYGSQMSESVAMRVEADSLRPAADIFVPATLAEAIALRAEHPEARLIAGGTDVGVLMNKRGLRPDKLISIGRLAALRSVDVEGNSLVIGAGVTWAELLPHLRDRLPQFAQVVERFGSPQIRHVGTVGGNIANASPIADSLPLLHVLEAELELVGPGGSRTVNVNDFYIDYKRFDLRPDELIARVRIPLPDRRDHMELLKVSRRRDMDISTFTAAVRMRIEEDRITDAAVALGAVGPVVLRLRKTEAMLVGRRFTLESMRAAGQAACEEISPISDVRGSAEYRRQLTRNVFKKFYCEQTKVHIDGIGRTVDPA